MQIAPSPALTNLIKHYLIIENQSAQQATHRFFPDGNPGLVFSYADSLIESGSDALESTRHQLFFYGQTNHFYDLKAGKNLGLLIVVFQPWGLYALSGLSGEQTINLRLSMEELLGASVNELQQQLNEQITLTSRIQLMEAFLLRRQQISDCKITIAQRAIRAMHLTGGTQPIQQLSQEVATTERSLERYFKHVIGISPKHYSRITRLQSCLKMHRQEPQTSAAQLAYWAGYYDQAHYIQEFAQLTGFTPGQYTANTRRLAVNLVPLIY